MKDDAAEQGQDEQDALYHGGSTSFLQPMLPADEQQEEERGVHAEPRYLPPFPVASSCSCLRCKRWWHCPFPPLASPVVATASSRCSAVGRC